MTRDLRDPQLLGDKLLTDATTVRSHYEASIPLSEIWDLHVSKFLIPDYQTIPERHEKKPPRYELIRVR